MKLPRLAPALFLLIAALCAANGQQAPPQSQKPFWMDDPSSLPKSITRIQQGKAFAADYEVVARWHDVQAIPLLKSQFETCKDSDTKSKIANVLLRLGAKDGPFWDYLANNARKALREAPPTPFDYDASGAAIPTKPSKKFTEWADKHHMSLQQAWWDATGDAMGAIMNLGSSDDERAIPILREALASDDDFIKSEAARGLAELHDAESVPAIIHVCENAPKEAAASIAQSLVYFDDPAAQRAVDQYVPKSTAQELREARAHGKTPYK